MGMTREELRDYVDEQRTLNTIPYHVYSALIDGIDTLEQEPRWIPVSERLPEESYNSVLGWDAYRERCVMVQYLDGCFQIAGKAESFDIRAWMPLPEPYKMESEDNK